MKTSHLPKKKHSLPEEGKTKNSHNSSFSHSCPYAGNAGAEDISKG
ncbi:hypothetical protein [Chitinophaga oryziterrae]|nr:hypothetical protein [Chitinophaga oryziterrae]